MILFEKLTSAGLPVISATEDGAISSTSMTDGQRARFNYIVAEHFGALVYSISPKSDVVAVGKTLEITVMGATGDYVLIIEGLAVPEQNITIDETGVEVIELPAIDAGTYYIKGTGLLSQCVAKVEVI